MGNVSQSACTQYARHKIYTVYTVQYCTLHSLCKQITIGEENTEQKDCKYNISNEARL